MKILDLFTKFDKLARENNELLLTVDHSFPPELNQFLQTLPDQQMLLKKVEIKWIEKNILLQVTGQNNAAIPVKDLTIDGFKFTQTKLEFEQKAADTTLRSISSAEEMPQSLTLPSIIPLINTNQMIRILPFAADVIDAVPLKSLEIHIGPGTDNPTTLLIGLQLPKAWDIAEALTPLTDVQISLNLSYTTIAESGKLRTSLGGRIQSTIHLGQQAFDTMIYLTGGVVANLAVIPNEGNVLPGLADLAAVVGGQDLTKNFETFLKKIGLGGFAITGVGLTFDLSSKKVSNLAISSLLTLGETKMQGALQLPEFQFAGGLAKGSRVSLTSIIEYFFHTAEGFPNIDLSDFVMTAYPGDQSYSVYLEITDDWKWPIGATDISLSQVSMEIDVLASKASMDNGKAWSASGFIDAVLMIGQTGLQMKAKRDSTTHVWTFNGGLAQGSTVQMSEIASYFLPVGEAFPEEIPDVAVTELSLSYSPGTGAFSLDGTCTADWKLPFGAHDLTASRASLHISRDAGEGNEAGIIHSKVSIHCEGPAEIVEELIFQNLDFQFNFDQGEGWKLAGSVSAMLYEAEYSLLASLEQSVTERKFSLNGTRKSDIPLVQLDTIGALDAKELSIEITKSLSTHSATTEEASRLSTDSVYTWSLVAAGSIKLDLVTQLDVSGKVQLFSENQKAGLIFKADHADLSIPLPIPGKEVATHLGLDAVSIIRNQAPNGENSWSFDASAAVWFTDVPHQISKLLPSRLIGHFSANKQGVQISIDRILQPLEISIPDAQAGDIHIELGEALLDASNFAFGLNSTHLLLSMDIGIGLPEKLNNVFGKSNDGTPKYDIFRTYHQTDATSVTKLRLNIDSDKGLTLQPMTSPFEAITLVTEGMKTYCVCSLGKDGEFGEIKFEMPAFGYDGTSFAASGGFQQTKPLKLPLTLLKTFFERNGLQKLNDVVPDALSFQEINVFDDKGQIHVDAFVQHLEKLGGFTLPPEFTDALHVINESMDKLPDEFKKYFNIKIPDGFSFDIHISEDGGVRLKAAVEGDTPIRFLMPIMGALGPEVQGIELYSITFGEVLGGALLLLTADIRIDRYDFITLASAMALPTSAQKILPDSHKLMDRTTIKDLFMLIVYETIIPIPIPLFVDELSYHHLGLEGVDFQFGFHFPKPHLNATEILRLFKRFQDFFTKKDSLLDPKAKPENVDLVLSLGPNYLQLPKYLGGKLLGSRTDEPSISAYESMASLLNFLKTVSLNAMIQSIPLDKRVGKEHVTLACLNMDASWLLTTPDEFVKGEYQQLQVAQEDASTLLQVLPPSPSPDQQGAVLFLTGNWVIKDIASLETWFGLVGTSSGFATGVRISGAISHLLAAELKGNVVISPKSEEVFSLVGHSHLSLLGKDIFTGDLSISNQQFAIDGKLDLFPDSPLLRITGHLTGRISDQALYLQGAVSAVVEKVFTLASASAELTHDHVKLSGTWLNQTVTFAADKAEDAVQLKASLAPIDILGVLKVSGYGSNPQPYALLGIGSNQVPEVKISGGVSLLGASEETDISFGKDGFSFTLHGQIFDFADAKLEAHGGSLVDGNSISVSAAMQQDLFDYINQYGTAFIRKQVEADDLKLQAAIQTVDTEKKAVDSLNGQIDARRKMVQKSYDDATSLLASKQHDVDEEKNKVNSLNGQIEQRRKAAQRDFNNATQALTNKQRDLQNKQNVVNQLQSQINEHNRKIKELKKEWLNPNADAKLIWHETQVAALEISRTTALGALEVAKQALELAKKTIHVVPVESDPQLLVLISAQQTAVMALAAASKALEAAKQTVKIIPAESDPELITLYTSRDTAQFTLDQAKDALQMIREANKTFAKVASYVASLGWDQLLQVHSASFSETLHDVKDGSVKLQVSVKFMNKESRYELDFDFHNPLESVEAWVNTLPWK